MAKPRIHELAKEHGVDSKTLLRQLELMGEFYKSPSSTVEPPVARKLRAVLSGQSVPHRVFGAITSAPDDVRQHLASLPAGLPELARTLVGEERTAQEKVLAKAVSAGAFFFVAEEDAQRLPHREGPLSTIEVRELPAVAGVVAIESDGEHRLVFWSVENGRLLCWTLAIRAGAGDPVTVTRPDRADVEVAHAAVVSDRRAVRLLRRVLDLAPHAETGGSTGAARGHREYTGSLDPVVTLTYRRPPVTPGGAVATAGTGTGTPRDDGVRWKVRGHWRRHWFPSAKEHRPIWIAEHTSGAVGGEVVERDRVQIIRPVREK